ncbi:MAG: hypothetical protein ACRD2K_03575 [Terriglobales bacterium]
MASMHPVALALLILLVVGGVGLVIHLFHRGKTFSGYEELTADAQQLAKSLSGEIFRDGNDLVISGNYRKMPGIVRFSYDENTPGLNVHVKAKATFTMSVVPKGERAAEGRVLVRTPDDMFDARFQTRTDHPTQAKMFVGGKVVMQHLQKLCCSSRTFFTITTGAMELSELTIPTPYTGHHVTDHLESMAKLATALEDMPGSETIKVHKLEKERSNIIRGAIVVGAIAAFITVYAATSGPRGEVPIKELADTEAPPAGIMPVDAVLIRKVKEWQVAKDTDFTGNAAAWMRDSELELTGRVPGDYSGKKTARDVAYLLTKVPGQHRVCLLVEGVNLYDAEYPMIAGVARVSKEAIADIDWGKNPPQGTPDGDGLLIIRKPDDLASGLVLFASERRIVSAVPVNYTQIRLR